MRINHNIAALNTHRQLGVNNGAASKNLEKLSSGLKINRAGDDAAGLAISEKMRGQIRGLEMASKNAQDSISLIQTAEGALNETHSILQRMRELAVQASNDTNTDADRAELQKEIEQLTQEIDRIATTTEFNTKTLLTGEYGTKAVSSAPTNVSVKSSTAETISEGTFDIVVTNAAVQGTEVGDADLSGGVTITKDTNDTIIINGTTIKFEAGSYTADQIVNKLNEYSSKTGVTASHDGTNLTLTNNKYGVQTNSISGNAAATLVGAATTTAGEDAAITVDGQAVTVSVDANDGRVLTVTSGALKGIVLNAKGADNSTAELTVNKDELVMQIGANEGQTLDITIQDMRAASLGVDAIDVSTASSATSAITTIDKALSSVSSERAKLGAYQNRLEHTINNLGTSAENLTASESRIRDVDMAKEMMEFTKNNILSQAAQAMLAQANQQPQGVLQLLR